MKSSNYYDSMEAAASAMGLDLVLLKKVKRKGCKAFKGSRVYPDKLLAWLKEHQEELEGSPDTEQDKEQLACRKLRGQCERIEFDNQVNKELYVLKTEVDSWQTEKAESLKRLLVGKLINEMLPKIHGLGIPEQTPIVRGYITAIVTDFKKPLPKDKS